MSEDENQLHMDFAEGKYVELFKCRQDIIDEYKCDEQALNGATIYLAWYRYEGYSGSSLVIFEKDGKLYEVNGSHCSCNGLEGQWEPAETCWEALKLRKFFNCDGEEITAALQKVVEAHIG